ncbi:A disintegrin and metalloproteinase with thrombospondin motifs 2 isoform X2 [Rhincodon typus]|uniref:A disintegrin and metalloproteinase with thrombospondin motifs 2 isoform X2 n=1 Tax=Rhincodon typus TaxID=259920 RepID=UPI0020300EB1|nr:A disintegrin and metalloproteinase with thrombospondin motifs 2 isoform X2 [Rhincodon typus]
MVLLSLWFAVGILTVNVTAATGSEVTGSPVLQKFAALGQEFSLVTPLRTDSEGRFMSHLVSGSRVRRRRQSGPESWPGTPGQRSQVEPGQLFFNVTVFGQSWQLRLEPSYRLVAPGAVLEWQEDGQSHTQPLNEDCIYTGGISQIPEARVAISNCDGLVRS